jgi:hypothetical protein
MAGGIILEQRAASPRNQQRKKQQAMQAMPTMPAWPTPADAPGNIAPIIEVKYERLPN